MKKTHSKPQLEAYACARLIVRAIRVRGEKNRTRDVAFSAYDARARENKSGNERDDDTGEGF